MHDNFSKETILLNAVSSSLQVLVVGATHFVLYRVLIKTIGIEQLGIWSVVLATTSVANVANLGLAGSVVKFVSKYLARGDEESACGVIQTTAITLAVLMGVIFVASYPLVGWLLARVIPKAHLHEAHAILPYSLLSLWLSIVASVFNGSMDGYQKIWMRNALVMSASVLYLAFGIFSVHRFGLMGLAYSQVAQGAILLVGSWTLLRGFIPALPLFPFRWRWKLFREMVGYGANFQLITLFTMLFDPVTKALLAKFGGLSITGYYEMANKMILQLRGLIFSANRVLVPAIAGLHENNPKAIQEIYKKNYRLLLFISLPLFSSVIAFSPVISRLWVGHYEPVFVFFTILLSIAWFISTLPGPALFSYLGIGDLGWSTVAYAVEAFLNPLLGYVLGSYFGGEGVAVGWSITMVTGAMIIIVSYHAKNGISLKELIPRESLLISIASIAGPTCTFALYRLLEHSGLLLVSTSVVLLYGVILSIPIMLHPMRKTLTSWFSMGLLKRG